MRKRLLLGFAAMGYGKAIGILTQIALIPILAAHWGLVTYGQWLMLFAVPMFISASDLGFASAAGVRLIGEVARGQWEEALSTFQSAQVIITLLAGTIVLVAISVCLILPATFLRVRGGVPVEQVRLIAAMLCIYSFLVLQSAMFTAVARAMGRFASVTIIESNVQLAEALGVIGVALLGGALFEAAMVLITARLASYCLQRRLAKRSASWLVVGVSQARPAVIKNLLRPSIAAMAIPLANAAYLQGTAVAVGAAAGAASVPIYASLRTLSRVGLQLINMVNLPLMPEFTSANARGDQEREKILTGAVIALSITFGLCFASGLALFGEEILQVWTNGIIRPPQLMVNLTALSIGAAIVSGSIASLLLATNRHETFSYVFVAGAVATVTLTYFWVTRWGVTGAAAATLILEIVMLLVAWHNLRVPLRDMFDPRAWIKLANRS